MHLDKSLCCFLFGTTRFTKEKNPVAPHTHTHISEKHVSPLKLPNNKIKSSNFKVIEPIQRNDLNTDLHISLFNFKTFRRNRNSF